MAILIHEWPFDGKHKFEFCSLNNLLCFFASLFVLSLYIRAWIRALCLKWKWRKSMSIGRIWLSCLVLSFDPKGRKILCFYMKILSLPHTTSSLVEFKFHLNIITFNIWDSDQVISCSVCVSVHLWRIHKYMFKVFSVGKNTVFFIDQKVQLVKKVSWIYVRKYGWFLLPSVLPSWR
jgi:hypothetical protein